MIAHLIQAADRNFARAATFCAALTLAWPAAANLDNAAPQAYGWHELAGTRVQDVCPANGFNGIDYAFYDKCKGVTGAWNSAAFDTTRNRLMIWGGGHDDYYGNEVYALDLVNQTMQRLTDPAPIADRAETEAQSELAPFDGSQPNSRHTYDAVAYLAHADRMWAYGGAMAGGILADRVTWLFDPGSATWQRANARGDIPDEILGVVSAYDPVTGNVYLHDRSGLLRYTYDAAGGEYERLSTDGLGLGLTAAIDPARRRFIVVGRRQFFIYDLDPESGYARTEVPLSGDTAFMDSSAPGVAYDSVRDRIVAWHGHGRVFELDPDTLAWTSVAFSGGPGEQHVQGTFDRWSYAPDLQAFVLYNTTNDNAYTLKPLVGIEDVTAPAAPAAPAVSMPYAGAVVLAWTAPNDDVGVAGYQIYRDDVLVGETDLPTFSELHLADGAHHEYHVVAYDSAGNMSQSSPRVGADIVNGGVPLPLGDCAGEPALAGRDDVVFCEPWERDDWWSVGGYLADPIVDDPRPAVPEAVDRTQVIEEGCYEGRCLKLDTPVGITRSLSLHWPLRNAGLAPRNLQVRYYLKLGDTWDANMCDAEGNIIAAGGKLPGPADVRTWADPGGQCGNGGARPDGRDCWSMRSMFIGCDNNACASKPEAVARFGSYVYHGGQGGATGDAGYWDGHLRESTTGGWGDCETNPNNFQCGRGDAGVLERGRWYQVEIQSRMNTPGQSDGLIRGWIDGVLSFEKTNMAFRQQGHDLLHNRLVWLNVYKGGVLGNCTDGEIYLDQMVIGTGDPIGGLANGTLQPPEISLSVSNDLPEPGEQVDVDWTSVDADSCEASGVWSGPRATSGEEAVTAAPDGGEVRLTCTGPGGETVRARLLGLPDTGGNGGGSGANGQDTEPPSTPTDVVAAVTASRTVTLNWTASTDDSAVAAYRVYLGDLQVARVEDTSFESVPLAAGAQAAFSIAAVDTAGKLSPRSEAVPASIPASQQANGVQQISLAPSSDASIGPSTRSPQGDATDLYIDPLQSSLLAFPLALPPGAIISQATLELDSVHQYAPMTLAVYLPAGQWHENTVTHYANDRETGSDWVNEGGDWIDANGVAQGAQPFVEQALGYAAGTASVQLDVTEVVRQWHDGTRANTGFFLRDLAVGGHGQRFAAKESGNGARLVIEYQLTADQIVLDASADALLHPSTSRNLGGSTHLDLAPESAVLLQFDLPELPAGTVVTNARLQLHKLRDYYQPLSVVAIFGVAEPWYEYAVTRTYADSSTGAAWDNYLGDWVDTQGTPQGMAPFTQVYLESHGQQPQAVELDVTDLVAAWIDGSLPNNGIFVKPLGGGSTHRYTSREGAAPGTHSPRLVIDFAN